MNSETMNPNKMNSDTMNSEYQMQIKTYRYKFSDEIANEISYFAKMHQYDDQKTFKEEWAKWIEPNSSKIQMEIQRLTELGAEGDIMDKLYKSARYYYRKKPTNPPPAKTRKDYTRFSETILNIIDANIREQLDGSNRDGPNHDGPNNDGPNKHHDSNQVIDVSPAEAYHLFCKTKIDDITNEVQLLMITNKSQSWVEISNKFKKTYKNRYYNICNKHKYYANNANK
jgi:hypothetical protein